MSPLEENTTAHRIAIASGFEYVREYRRIEITDLAALKAAGAHGVVKMGTAVQVVIGTDADPIAADIEDLM